MHTRLASRLNGRIMARGKARGGDGSASDTDLQHVPQQAADATAMAKVDLSRRPPPLLPGQAAAAGSTAGARMRMPAGASSTGLGAAPFLGGALGAPAPVTTAPGGGAGPTPSKAPLPQGQHRRSRSASLLPAGAGQLQPTLSDDLVTYADVAAAAAAAAAAAPGPQPQGTQQPAAAASDSLQRRSTRLAAAAAAAAGDAGASGGKALSRASAPARPSRVAALHGGSSSSLRAAAATATAAPLHANSAAAAAQPAAAAADAATPPPQRPVARRVRFAPGPLDPGRHPHSSPDGHPASEGLLALPVRRVPASYGLDLSRGNVLMLEQLLGAECAMSVSRLKRRVGLLPPMRPPRPHATTTQPHAAAAAAAPPGALRDGAAGAARGAQPATPAEGR